MNWSNKKREKLDNKFCCDYLRSRIEKNDSRLHYEKMLREFYIERVYSTSVNLIQYCPWCGAKLPKELRNEWFDILEKEYNIETDAFEWRERKDIPEEFKSDEWWKKRGL